MKRKIQQNPESVQENVNTGNKCFYKSLLNIESHQQIFK